MASFYAELEVGGRTYPVRSCQFEFTQATGERGRVAAKVRHGLVHLTLDMPDDDVLLDWAATPHKPLAGHVNFFAPDRRTAHKTLACKPTSAWAVGYVGSSGMLAAEERLSLKNRCRWYSSGYRRCWN